MLFDKIIPAKYHVKSEACAVEVCFEENDVSYYHTVVKNSNNKITIRQSGVSTGNLELPPLVEKNKIPCLVIINGKGVIIKKISLQQDDLKDHAGTIHRNLPAFNMQEFCAQLYPQQDGSAYIALCRVELVDAVLAELRHKKCETATLHIGVPAAIGLQPLWAKFGTLPVSVHQLELSNNVIDAINPAIHNEDQTITIEDLSFSSRHALGFASGLAYFMQRNISAGNKENVNGLPVKHTEKNKFRFLTITAVAIAFVVAVANVIIYTTQFDKNNKLESELSVYQGKYEKINQLLAEYQKNKDLIENAGVLGKNKLSEYSDRIGETLPDEVSLSDLYFNPKREDDESEDSLVTFESKHITLKGSCGKSLIVNEWINVLKMQKFIKSVSLERFVYNSEGLVPNFEIKLVTE